jgi:hypothetical protein
MASTLILACVAPVSADITSGLVGYWPLNGDAIDASGHGANGTINGNVTPAPDRMGSPNSAMRFDGASGSNINVGNPSQLQITGELTLAAWVSLNGGQTNNARIISKAGGSGNRCWSLNIENDSGGVRYPATFQIARNGTTNISVLDTQSLPTDEWVHMAGVYRPGQAIEVYVNGELHATNSTDIPATQFNSSLAVLIGNRAGASNLGWPGMIDEARVYTRALSAADIKELVFGRPGLPANPTPADGATDVPSDSMLSWAPGEFAVTHDVYFGTSLSGVNDASLANPLDVLAGKGQDATTYDCGRLDFGTTYFWRVDEVNGPPDNTVYKGDVWSFTSEPVAYPLTNVTATASSFAKDMGPGHTVDGSGLTGDQHSTQNTAMWLTGDGTQLPAWIQYEFDQVRKLHELWVWNSNQNIESIVGFGVKDVTIKYSLDGAEWSTLRNELFDRASGGDSYQAGTIVDMAGVLAKFVRLTITSNWGGMVPQTGLSEVRFFYIPVQARAPQPAFGATDVAVDSVLSWRAGREATAHKVYFGTDEQAVIDGTAPVEVVAERRFTPHAMEYGQVYYWRVDEVNEAATPSLWEGDVWSFSTQEYVIVDDFESYTNSSPKRLFQTWIDGLGFSPDDFFPQGHSGNGTGAIVGYDPMEGDVAERTIVKSGRQSMPLTYNNKDVATSEAQCTFPAQDWTAHGIKSLSLYFHGGPGNTGQLYLKINNTKVPYGGDANDIAAARWQVWPVDLSAVGGNLSNVTKLTIGVEGAGATGVVYIDDIRLYPRAPEYITPVEPNSAKLLAHYDFEGNANDSSGNNLNGAIVDGQLVSPGKLGQGMAVQVNDAGYVNLGNPALLDFGAGDWTVTAWFKTGMTGTGDDNDGTVFAKGGDSTGGHRYALIMSQVTEGAVSLVCDDDVTKEQANSTTKTNDDRWHFVAGQREGTFIRIYIDGRLEATEPVEVGYNLSGTTQHNAYIGAITDHSKGSLYKLFIGLIDDVRVYGRALSEGEILWLAGKTVPVPKPF